MSQTKKSAAAPKAKPGAARSRKGAKKRAMRVVRKGPVKDAALEDLFAFWSPAIQRLPPPLRTSFGNFTTLNSVARFTITTLTTQAQYIWIDWCPTSLAALYFTNGSSAGGSVNAVHYGTLVSSAPTSIRPLRMGFRLENITQFTNVAGSVRVYSLDNPILTGWAAGATSTTPAGFTSTPDSALGALIDSAPDTEEFPAAHFTTEQEFVSVPSSYPSYNEYYPYSAFAGTTTTGAALQSIDLGTLIAGQLTTYTAGAAFVSGTYGSAGLGGLPPVRGFLLEFPPAATAQTYRLTVRRQDGARYPVNTLGATFAGTTEKMSASSEDCFLHWAKLVTPKPARSVPAPVVSDHATTGMSMQSVLAGAASAFLGGAVEAGTGYSRKAGMSFAERAFGAALAAM